MKKMMELGNITMQTISPQVISVSVNIYFFLYGRKLMEQEIIQSRCCQIKSELIDREIQLNLSTSITIIPKNLPHLPTSAYYHLNTI